MIGTIVPLPTMAPLPGIPPCPAMAPLPWLRVHITEPCVVALPRRTTKQKKQNYRSMEGRTDEKGFRQVSLWSGSVCELSTWFALTSTSSVYHHLLFLYLFIMSSFVDILRNLNHRGQKTKTNLPGRETAKTSTSSSSITIASGDFDFLNLAGGVTVN